MDELIKNINSAENGISKFTRLIEMDTPVLKDRKEDLASKKSELDERTALQKKLDDDRKLQIEKFNAIVAEHNMVRSMLHKARAIMEKTFASG